MQEIVGPILASIAANGALVWLTRTWIGERLKSAIQHEYDQKLEAHKAKLQAQHTTELERLRADLRIAAFERETRFARLHAQRAETISGIYARLQELMRCVHAYVDFIGETSDPPLPDRREVVNKANRAFNDFYLPRRIFLPNGTEKRVTELHQELYGIVIGFAAGVEGGSDSKTGFNSWAEAYRSVVRQATPVFDALKTEFRQLLGDDK